MPMPKAIKAMILLMLLRCGTPLSEWEEAFYTHILLEFDYLIHGNSSFYNKPTYRRCYDELESTLSSNVNEFYVMLSNSGKEQFDLGNEEECIRNSLTYFLIVYKKNSKKFVGDFSPSFKFLSKDLYFYGFCIKSECEDFVTQFFNPRLNKDFYLRVKSRFGIDDIDSILINNKKVLFSNEKKVDNYVIIKEYSKTHNIFITVFVTLSIWFGIKVGVFFLGMIFQNKKNFKKMLTVAYANTVLMNQDKLGENEEEENEEDFLSYQRSSKESIFVKAKRKEIRKSFDQDCALMETPNINDTSNTKNVKSSRMEEENDTFDNVSESSYGTMKRERLSSSTIKKEKSCCSLSLVYTFLSFGSSFKLIFTERNFIYNDTELELVCFLRVYALFWITFNHNIWALIRIPGRDFNQDGFFRNILFSLVKYSIYSMELWISIEGLILGYKLLSYIKKNSKKISFCHFVKFYLHSVSKIAIFIFVFFMLHLYVQDYEILSSNQQGALFEYLKKNIIYCRECVFNPSLITNPFYLQYSDFFKQEIAFSQCFKFVYLFLNEHICFVLTLIIFYTSLKLKSKKFEYAIVALFILNFSLSVLSTKSYIGQRYSFIFFLGETASLKYTHLYYNTYLTGVFVGVAFFYYKDATSKDPTLSSENPQKKHLPFKFFYNIIMYIEHLGEITKGFLIALMLFIHLLLSLSFYFFCNIFETENNDKINFVINEFVYLFSTYEKKIFLVTFYLMFFCIVTFPKDTIFNHLYNNNIFASFSRVGFCYICSLDVLVYLFYCFFHVDLYFNYQNLFYFTFGLSVALGLVNIFFVILVEIPVRTIIKVIS